MFGFIKKSREKRRLKTTFQEFGFEIMEFHLPEFGQVQFARWQNPFESEKIISQSQVNFYKKFLKSGDFIIDIGAHVGDTTLPMALAVGKEGTALAFDPNPYVFKILKENSGLNKNFTNIIPLNFAITASEGYFFFNSSEATFNNGGISENQKNHNGKYGLPKKVKGIQLQNYLEASFSEILPRLSLIKVDAEGYDIEILRSISSLITKYRPHLIFECFKQLNKQQRENLYHEIADKNYDLYYVEGFDENSKMRLLKAENMMDRKHFDVLAMPK